MTQGKNFSFGIDKITFIDDEYNVFGVDDPQNCALNLTYEITQHRGGANNDVRASAVHSRNGEFSLGTGYIDAKLAQLLTGGTITSLGTSAASVTTGTASGVNTLYGTTATLPAGISTVTINSPTLVKTSDYYITADVEDKVTVTRQEDGKQFTQVTLTNSATGFDLDSERGIQLSTTVSATSLTVGEKAIVSLRQAINTINQSISFDSTKPTKLSIAATVDFNGYRRVINIPVAQPSGTVQGNSATEFQVQDITMQVENSAALDEMANIILQG
jgi:hypothetical protein